MAGDDVVIEAFTELASSYEETVDRELRQFWGLSYRQFIDRLVGQVAINEGDMVLDVATGTALIPLKIAGKLGVKGKVVGLDITPAMLGYAQKNVATAGSGPAINLVCASATHMPFVENAFDVVICGLGMHHIEVSQMLSEMKRVLKGGGRLVMADVGATPFWRSLWGNILLRILLVWYGLSYRSARAQAEMEAFSNVRTAEEWHTTLADSGFTDIEITEFPARRRWYPCALMMKAVAEGRFGGTKPLQETVSS